jgi:molybdopterin molybdotransferase
VISVEEARTRLLSLVRPLPVERTTLREAPGRVLAEPIVAPHAQPPFAASAMDGYAVTEHTVTAGASFRLVGEAAAGHPFRGRIEAGDAVRIFTGAPLPEGARRVVIQEDVAREDDRITVTAEPGEGTHVRPAGGDFAEGFRLTAPRRLGFADVALAAAMGHGALPVRRRPEVAILMTGDELVPPGEPLLPGHVFASNGYGLAAMLEAEGAACRLLPLVRDRPEELAEGLRLARGADLIVTIGGASVGDHDLVAGVAGTEGLDLAFHKVRMRPGKPLLAGRLGRAAMVGLPGNPVSALVCGVIFVLPMLRAMLDLPPGPSSRPARLAAPLPANGPREHYMRGRLRADGTAEGFGRQDSSLLTVLAEADILVVRPPDDPPRAAAEAVRIVPLPGYRHG